LTGNQSALAARPTPIKNKVQRPLKNTVKKHVKKQAVAVTEPEVPQAFLCPITYELMEDPVVAGDGHTYERQAIEHWFSNRNRSPMTSVVLDSKALLPNFTLKSMIADFKQKQKNN
jgi:hypothetical protein